MKLEITSESHRRGITWYFCIGSYSELEYLNYWDRQSPERMRRSARDGMRR